MAGDLDLVAARERKLERKQVRPVIAPDLVRPTPIVDRTRIVIPEEGESDLPQSLEAHHLTVEERHGPHGHWSEFAFDFGQIALLHRAQRREVAPRLRREHAVGDDQVARVAEQVEVGE